MAVKDGTDVVLQLAATVVNGATNHSMEEVWEEIVITTKDSSKAKEILAGEYSGGISIEGILDEADTYTYSEIRTAANLRTAVAFIFGGETAGDVTYSGNCFILGLTLGAPKNGAVVFTARLVFTGFPVEGTVAA